MGNRVIALAASRVGFRVTASDISTPSDTAGDGRITMIIWVYYQKS